MIVDWALNFALLAVALALLLCAWRLLRGPELPDRVLALDTLYVNVVALVVLLGMRQRHASCYFEAALLIALLGFVSTVALARYLSARRRHRVSAAMDFAQLHWAWQALIAALLVVGGLFALVGAIGLLRFRTSTCACTHRPRPRRWASAACCWPAWPTSWAQGCVGAARAADHAVPVRHRAGVGQPAGQGRAASARAVEGAVPPEIEPRP